MSFYRFQRSYRHEAPSRLLHTAQCTQCAFPITQSKSAVQVRVVVGFHGLNFCSMKFDQQAPWIQDIDNNMFFSSR
jgi:hypothetical protein